jgi:aminoglycoside phosphotransferase family enzyme
MAVLSLDSESGFLARCWKGGGSVFLDRVSFRDRIYFVDRVGFRDRICLVDRVGFRDRICFVDMVGFVRWKRMDRIKLNQNKSKPATKLNLEHELRIADSKTELCKG